MKPINRNLKSVTMGDIEKHKAISEKELLRDLMNLIHFDERTNKNSFAGNPFLYHYQMANLLRCRRQDGKTIYDLYNDPLAWKKLIAATKKRDRGGRTAAGNIFECFRINHGAVVMFKSTAAKYLYAKYGATSVLDPTAGWGGRMLGAWSLNIPYTGIDTNKKMKPAYQSMIKHLGMLKTTPLTMIWNDCLKVDFSKIDYDFVLTSPPYINLELYEGMKGWDSEDMFYQEFFIPLWTKCMKHCKSPGHVCFNISPKMYTQALAHGLPPADIEEDLKQQMGQKMGKKTDKIYIWKV